MVFRRPTVSGSIFTSRLWIDNYCVGDNFVGLYCRSGISRITWRICQASRRSARWWARCTGSLTMSRSTAMGWTSKVSTAMRGIAAARRTHSISFSGNSCRFVIDIVPVHCEQRKRLNLNVVRSIFITNRFNNWLYLHVYNLSLNSHSDGSF